MVQAVEQHRRFSVAVWKKKTSVILRIKLTLLDLLIVFFISVNHEFSQICNGKGLYAGTPEFPINLVETT